MTVLQLAYPTASDPPPLSNAPGSLIDIYLLTYFNVK